MRPPEFKWFPYPYVVGVGAFGLKIILYLVKVSDAGYLKNTHYGVFFVFSALKPISFKKFN